MAGMPSQQILKKVSSLFSTEQLKDKGFYKAGTIPPLSIIRLSSQFGSLNLAKEEILFLYDKSLGALNKGFILTDCNIHFYKGFMPLTELNQLFDESGNLLPPFPDLEEVFKNKLGELFGHIAKYDSNADSNMAKYGSPEAKGNPRDFSVPISGLNEQENKSDSTSENLKAEEALLADLIDAEFLKILKAEGDKLISYSKELDKDTDVKNSIRKMANTTDIIVHDPSSKELFAQDLIKLFNIATGEKEDPTRREKIVLAYFFERLIGGGDMAESIKVSRINGMLENDKFHQNFDKLMSYRLFDVKGEFPDQLLLPTLLSKIDHESFSEIGSRLYHFASLVIKADGKITQDEEKRLKEILDLINKPKKSIPNVKQTEFDEDETLEDVFAELNELIGLKNIKGDISTLINFLKVQKAREDAGLKTQSKALHSVFMGPPGTGKTTIARLMAKIYKQMGFLKKGHLVETDRAGLVAGYIGQTAKKTDEIIEAALDGVLFIDEAYSLARGGEDKRDFGHEAIETLLKRMEDYRKRLVIIVAGYPDEMEDFINANPGLKSRFNRYFKFNHYNARELADIYNLFARKADFKLTADAEEKLFFIFEELYSRRHKNFGNARSARNIFDQCIERQANRIVSIAPLTEEVLMTLTVDDIPPIRETVEKILVFDMDAHEAKKPDPTKKLENMMGKLGTILPGGLPGGPAPDSAPENTVDTNPVEDKGGVPLEDATDEELGDDA